MSEEYEEKDVFVLLDFQGKDTTKLLKQQHTYFRMLNLNETKPIVELGDDVYEGIYEDAVGTNIFFEEVEDLREPDLFEGDTPITLKYLLKQSKVLKLKHIGTKPKLVLNPCPVASVNISVNEDYRVLLDKLKNDELNIDDYVVNEMCLNDDTDDDSVAKTSDTEIERLLPATTKELTQQIVVPEWYTVTKEHTSNTELPKNKDNVTYSKYRKLQRLAEEPTRHKNVDATETAFEQPVQSFPPTNNFIAWKNMMMRVVEQQSINLDVNKHNLEDFVDIEESIKLGIIEHSTIYTKQDKQKLFSLNNFINLSPLMKLIVLQDCLQFEKAEMENMNKEQINKKGDDNFTPKERLKLLDDFKKELKMHILSRIKDAQKYDELLMKINIDFNLSDEEDSYEGSSTNYEEDSEDENEEVQKME